MHQKKFQRILQKYNWGEATPEERELINSWYQKMGEASSSTDEPEPFLEARYWKLIKRKLSSDKKEEQRFLHTGGWLRLGVAATVLLGFILFIYLTRHPTDKEEANVFNAEATKDWEILSNTDAGVKQVVLPDGSCVALDPKSKLRYSLTFNKNEREVYLEGRAFFQVTHNESIPFRVHAGEILTQVIGTEFTISDIPGNQEVIVAVKSGKVSVFKKSLNPPSQPSQKTILTPNHEAVFEKLTGKITQKLVDEPEELIIPEAETSRRVFDDAPVVELLETMEMKYGIDIDFDKEILSHCLITTTIGDGNFYKRLDIICEAIGASYTIDGSQIIFTSQGCSPVSSN